MKGGTYRWEFLIREIRIAYHVNLRVKVRHDLFGTHTIDKESEVCAHVEILASHRVGDLR